MSGSEKRYRIPNDRLYTRTHEWALPLDDGTVKVGITDYAQNSLHEVVYVELPEEGRDIKQGEAFMSVESVKAVSEIYAPISGKIVEVNEVLADNPEKVNEDPYGEGWMVRIEPSNWNEESKSLLKAEEYERVVEEEEKGGH